ncbi:hypothetical protein DSL72_003380 [Monilinia vaccinii-corymbosi]|uniref:Uncharacterized protein n=1 Tax=Monilinia vaccinii-corymbosi TaxID=61207 RepID=A0A8A3NT46_9HELO|nr:hypothetical protein DSL72_003380 [Monilinia vaccinii-corymbosi]
MSTAIAALSIGHAPQSWLMFDGIYRVSLDGWITDAKATAVFPCSSPGGAGKTQVDGLVKGVEGGIRKKGFGMFYEDDLGPLTVWPVETGF